MHTLTLDSLNLNDGTIYRVKRIPIFRTAKKRIDIQPYLQDHGGEIIEGTNFDDVVTHSVPVYVYGTSVDNLYANVQALQKKIEKTNVTFEYKYSSATNSTYATVLYMEASDPFEENDWDYLVEAKQCLINIEMICMPDWYGAQQTIGPLYYSKTPAIIQPSTVLGDLEAPCVLELSSSGSKAIGNKLYIGTRSKDRAISQAVFNTIKDFQGSSSASGFYNNQYARTVCSSAWTNLTGNSENINAIDFVNANVGFAACDGGLVLRTTNGGTSVTRYSSTVTGTANNLNGIHAASSNVVLVCGNNGTIKRSTNGGVSWTNSTSGTANHLNALAFASSNVGWTIGDNGTVIRTTNGLAWSAQTNGIGSYNLNDIYALSTNTVLIGRSPNDAAGVYPTIKTANGGSSWAAIGSGTHKNIYGVHITGVGAGNIWIAVGDYGSVQTSQNDGASWSTQASGTTQHLRDVDMQSGALGWIVGNDGLIAKSTNYGVTWTQQISGVAANLNSVAVINSTQVYIAGDGYTILKTTNGGTAWTQPTTGAWVLGAIEQYQDTYRLLARCRTNSTNPDGVQMRASVGWAGGSIVASSAVSLANTTKQQVVDCGNLTVPVVPLSSGVSSTPIWKLEARNGSTKSINVDMDWGVGIPQSGQINYCTTTATAAKPITYDYNSEAVNKGFTNVDWVGDPGIKLNPGLNNNIVIAESQTWSTGTQGYNPVNVTMSYFPRYRSPVVGSTT